VTAAPTATVTIAAFDPGHTVAVAAPEHWHDRVRALEPYTRYGPTFLVAVLEQLSMMDTYVGKGWYAHGHEHLVYAEVAADIDFGVLRWMPVDGGWVRQDQSGPTLDRAWQWRCALCKGDVHGRPWPTEEEARDALREHYRRYREVGRHYGAN
jgi:hypothetical protein